MKVEIGKSFELDYGFSQEEVDAFVKMTGDNNPIHYDEQYAAMTDFKKPIIHGFLSASVFSRIFGTLYPGEGTVYLAQQLRFLRPMHVGEKYTARVEVLEVTRETHRCRMSTRVFDQQRKPMIIGEASMMNVEQIN